jgi:hypothetical protein
LKPRKGVSLVTGVGRGEGTGVGTGEGCGEGTGVGATVGKGKGFGVGTGDGIGVGIKVGTGEGLGDGSGDGRGVGSGEGLPVGVGDGSGVGLGVGNDEGLDVWSTHCTLTLKKPVASSVRPSTINQYSPAGTTVKKLQLSASGSASASVVSPNRSSVPSAALEAAPISKPLSETQPSKRATRTLASADPSPLQSETVKMVSTANSKR